MLARVGGGEFVALLPAWRDADAAQSIADALRARIAKPFGLPDGPCQLDVSIGIDCFPADGIDAETLLTHAGKRRRSLRVAEESRD